MTDPQRDTKRTIAAAKEILADRDPITDRGAVMVTLEGTVSAILLLVMGGDHKKAAAMLNEGLIQGVENLLAYAASKQPR